MFKFIISLILIFLININATENTKYSQAELDQMLAPIALYPDALLSQILMATTFNSQLKEAIDYSKANPNEKGDEAVKKVQDRGWDASVSSLVAFPDVLSMLGSKPEWSKSLGDAFLDQPDIIMDTIQNLRQKAKEEGNLETTQEQKVEVDDSNNTQIIIVTPVTQTVYVPVYNPTYVYGPWMYPSYPPYYYYPPHYNPVPGFVFGFTVGIMASNCLWGGFGWHNHSVNINVNRYNNINVNKISVKKNNVNWNSHNQRSSKGVPSSRNRSSKDIQRENARKAMGNKGLSLSNEREKLSGSSGDKIRKDLNSGKFKSSSHSNAFSGIDRPNRSKLETKRGSSSRNSSTRNFKSQNNFSGSNRGNSRASSRGNRSRGRR